MNPESPQEEDGKSNATETPKEEGKQKTGQIGLGAIDRAAKPVKIGPDPLNQKRDKPGDRFEHEGA